jgi:competence protein ComEC
MKTRVLCCLVLLFVLIGLVSCAKVAPFELEIRFLDVGQGDAVLLRTSEGDVLVDAGSDSSQEELCLRLEQIGVRELALAVFTHSDEDHIGGADGVLRRFPTQTVWISHFFEDNLCTRMLLDAAADTGAEVIEVTNGWHRMLGTTGIAVFSPYGDMKNADDNDCSIVLKVACRGVSALLMGDASTDAEEMLPRIHDRTQLDCDILKVAHHGASSSTGDAFLQAATPSYAVISCGAGNFYGHPHGEVLERLKSIGAKILRTDLDGEIVFQTDGKAVWQP